ncbi:hypothetical protein MYP_2995 [Sporocytophaga myxococcoides]|uniref:Uncharacterized protein n=2 Tax=Sporocytophaga myxococcoides TaxID=153721 RepID=A0A098LFM7_9BACT|nr:hypothetical protein MYP_2995 [Sporocytophaga myxococcoides]
MKFIEFRGQYGDIQIFIDSDLELYPDINIEDLTVEQKDLLILNQVNLKQVQKVECFSSSDIVFTFIDNTVLKISGNPQDETIAEPWQLTNKKGVDQMDYISIVGLTGDGFAVWGSLDNLKRGS